MTNQIHDQIKDHILENWLSIYLQVVTYIDSK